MKDLVLNKKLKERKFYHYPISMFLIETNGEEASKQAPKRNYLKKI